MRSAMRAALLLVVVLAATQAMHVGVSRSRWPQRAAHLSNQAFVEPAEAPVAPVEHDKLKGADPQSDYKMRKSDDKIGVAALVATAGNATIFSNVTRDVAPETITIHPVIQLTQEARLKSCVGPCGEGMHFFVVWTTKAAGWNDKYTRALDSALYYHPKAKLSIYSSSLPSDFLEPFAALGYNVSVEKLNMRHRAKGTPLEKWVANMGQWHKGPYYYAHLADAVRLLVLYNEGGVYFDVDVVWVNAVDKVRNALGWEKSDEISNAVMIFDKRNKFIEHVMTAFVANYTVDSWDGPGPVLLTNVYTQGLEYGGIDGVADWQQEGHVVHVLDRPAFYLVSWDDIHTYFEKASFDDRTRDVQIVRHQAYAMHLWNSRTHDLTVHPESAVAELFRSTCVLCTELQNPDEAEETEEEHENQPKPELHADGTTTTPQQPLPMPPMPAVANTVVEIVNVTAAVEK